MGGEPNRFPYYLSQNCYGLMKLPACFKIMLFLVLACSGCKVKETTDPDLAYEYWAGNKPPKRIKVINGRYLQSSHLSRAFTLYLEVQATPDWREKFIQQNKLKKGI